MQEYALATPRNVFLYGRGGRRNLTCVWRLVAAPSQRVQLRFSNISVGGRSCKTVLDPQLGSYSCEHRGPGGVAGAWLTEGEGETEAVQQCHCQVMSNTVITSTSSAITLTFRVTEMLPSQDFRDFLLQGSFRFINVHCQDKTVARGGGAVTLDYRSSDNAICDKRSWSVRARPRTRIYLEVAGTLLPRDKAHVCAVRGRVIVRTAGTMFIICPSQTKPNQGPVSLWSPVSGSEESSLQSVTVQLAGQGHGSLTFTWVELAPVTQQSALLLATKPNLPRGVSCGHVCPGLGACIRHELVCDGAANCPDSSDEASCPHLVVPLYYLYSVLAASFVVFLLTAAVLVCRCSISRFWPRVKIANVKHLVLLFSAQKFDGVFTETTTLRSTK